MRCGASDQQHAAVDPDRQQGVSACVGLAYERERLDLARGVIQIEGVNSRPAVRDEGHDIGTYGCRIPNHGNII